MTQALRALPDDQATAVKKLLVVDDSKLQRKLLTVSLRKWGYEIREAESGKEALALCIEDLPDLILSDWMMPEMDGLEFCKNLRKIDAEKYVYFILLTSKSDNGDVALGLEVGADDFLTKPVNHDELKARLSAGERILNMQQKLSETLAEIQILYNAVDKDLLEAKKLQQSLVRERYKDFGPAEVSLLLQSSGHVGGDLVSFFSIDEQRVGLFAIDVSGHGISSALMTARLAGFFSGETPEHNIALRYNATGDITTVPPKEVAEKLNDLVHTEMETEHYFTLLLAYVNLDTGHAEIAQAGQPYPIIQRKNGSTEIIGTGGMPIGLIPDVDFEQFNVTLNRGDRLFMWSDGVTECPDPNGTILEDEGAEKIVRKHTEKRGQKFLEHLMWELGAYAQGDDFPDDISAIVFEFKP